MSTKIHTHSFDEIIDKNWPDGFKKTRQRIDIYRILFEAKEPLSAAEIFAALNSASDSSRDMYAFSTVYRNLLAFEKAGIVTKSVLSTEDNNIYELKQANHRHYAICLVCHTKFPISTCPLHEIAHEVKESLPDFTITGHQLEIYGYCKNCKDVTLK